jgi:hypothetical protein
MSTISSVWIVGDFKKIVKDFDKNSTEQALNIINNRTTKNQIAKLNLEGSKKVLKYLGSIENHIRGNEGIGFRMLSAIASCFGFTLGCLRRHEDNLETIDTFRREIKRSYKEKFPLDYYGPERRGLLDALREKDGEIEKAREEGRDTTALQTERREIERDFISITKKIVKKADPVRFYREYELKRLDEQLDNAQVELWNAERGSAGEKACRSEVARIKAEMVSVKEEIVKRIHPIRFYKEYELAKLSRQLKEVQNKIGRVQEGWQKTEFEEERERIEEKLIFVKERIVEHDNPIGFHHYMLNKLTRQLNRVRSEIGKTKGIAQDDLKTEKREIKEEIVNRKKALGCF